MSAADAVGGCDCCEWTTTGTLRQVSAAARRHARTCTGPTRQAGPGPEQPPPAAAAAPVAARTVRPCGPRRLPKTRGEQQAAAVLTALTAAAGRHDAEELLAELGLTDPGILAGAKTWAGLLRADRAASDAA